jgi:hypothetical protein
MSEWACWKRTRLCNQGVNGVFQQQNAQPPEERPDAENPTYGVLWLARSNEGSDRGKCQ